jgi:hypothetical protein
MEYLLHGVAHRLGRLRGKARKRSRELFSARRSRAGGSEAAKPSGSVGRASGGGGSAPCEQPQTGAIVRARSQPKRNRPLWSVDSEEKWAAATEPALIELRSLVTIVRSPIAEDDRDVPGFTHSRIPDLRPDFVYVDVSLPYETSLIRCCRYRGNPPTRLSDHDRRAEGHRSISEQAPEPPAHARASIRRLAPHRNTQLSA